METTYRVSGMSCDHCVRAVSTELAALGGVEDVVVDLGTGEVTVRSASALSLDEVAEAVDEAGYELVA